MTRIDRVVTSGTFSLDGQDFAVDNNIWVVGDDTTCVIIDAAHDADAILTGVGDRAVGAIICTHGHNDHVNVAPELAQATGAPILLHRADRELWNMIHPDRPPDAELREGEALDHGLQVMCTPGHTPGGCSLVLPSEGVVFSGDTLFKGGPGATGRSFSDFPTIIASIQDRLFGLPADMIVHTGHGDSTTIGAEAGHIGEWLARGH